MTTHAPPHRRPRLPAALIAVVALASALLVPLAPAAAAPVPVPDVPRAGISFNGPVYSIVMGDGVAYAGGSFTSVTGTNGTFSRSRLAAVDLATGAVTAFRADADATVRALALAAGSLFVGGDFTRVHGSARGRLAEVDSTTGALRTLHRDPNARVRALAAVGDRLYVGGDFTRVDGAARSRVAALQISSRSLDPSFAPVLNGAVHSLATTPTGAVVLAGGWFTSVNGSSTRRYLASFTPAGAVRAPVFALAHNNPVLGVDTDDEGTRVFAAVGGDVSGNQVASYDMATGAKRWFHHADGDVQALAYHDGNVYFGFHEGFAGDTSVRLLAADAVTGSLELAFHPVVNSFWGVWAVAASSRGVIAGGEFTRVSGVAAGRLAYFPATQPSPPPPPPVVEPPAATITGFAPVGTLPVVVLGPHGGTSATPSVLVSVTWTSGSGAVTSAAVTGSRVGAPSASLRFAAACGSTATCTARGDRVTISMPLRFSGTGRADRARVTALGAPGVYAVRPSATTSAGAVVGYGGPPLQVRYLRATRIASFNAAPEPVRAGSTVRVTGTVSKATVCADGSRARGCRAGQLGRWTPITRRAVSVFFDPSGPAPSRLVARVAPDRDGRFAIRLRQDVSGTWRAELRQTSEFGLARSRADLVRVVD